MASAQGNVHGEGEIVELGSGVTNRAIGASATSDVSD